MPTVKINGSVFRITCLFMKGGVVSVINIYIYIYIYFIRDSWAPHFLCLLIFLLSFIVCKNCHFLECGLCIQNVIGIYVLDLFVYNICTGCCHYV